MFAVCGIIAAGVGVIFGARLWSGGSMGLLSVAMPLVSLAWFALLGLKTWRHRGATPEPTPAQDRPSRRPPGWSALSSPKSSQSGAPDRQVSA